MKYYGPNPEITEKEHFIRARAFALVSDIRIALSSAKPRETKAEMALAAQGWILRAMTWALKNDRHEAYKCLGGHYGDLRCVWEVCLEDRGPRMPLVPVNRAA